MKAAPRLRLVALVTVALASAACAGCGRERATPALCRAILHRVIELELHERGYRDPALAARKQAELETLFGRELRECTGRRVDRGALACIARAKSTEQISHGCLR